MIEVRPAYDTECPMLLGMAEAMHAESPRYREIPLIEDKLQGIITLFHERANEAVLLVAVREGDILGMFWGYIDEFFFSNERYATDVLIYVKPEYRSGRVAYRLVKAFEEWAMARSITHIQMAVSTGIDNEGYARFYDRMGYSGSGIVMSKAAGDV